MSRIFAQDSSGPTYTPDNVLDQGLPANASAERTILGAILLDNECLLDVMSQLVPDDFALDSHKRIALRMGQLQKRGTAVDLVTLAEELGKKDEIEAIGGVAYLASLTEGLPRRPVIDDYISIVRNKALLRRLMFASNSSLARAAERSAEPLELIGDLQSMLEDLLRPIVKSEDAAVSSFVVEALEELNDEYRQKLSPCIPSGNPWFDAKTGGGYRHGKITLVCARPNVGKTPWAVMSTAYNLARGRKCVFFSLEMEKSEILRNLVPYVVDLPNVVVNRPWLQTPGQNALVNQAYSQIAEWDQRLKIYDGEMDADRICWTIDREMRNCSDVLFCLDHFGLITGGSKKAKDTRERYNENSSRLRRKIKHKKAALVILCQLRKVNREYAEKPPIPDDVKESGNMWEDAFAGLLIHRPYEKESVKMSKEAHLNLAKLRSGGSPGTVTGKFNTRLLRFEAEAELELDFANEF